MNEWKEKVSNGGIELLKKKKKKKRVDIRESIDGVVVPFLLTFFLSFSLSIVIFCFVFHTYPSWKTLKNYAFFLSDRLI